MARAQSKNRQDALIRTFWHRAAFYSAYLIAFFSLCGIGVTAYTAWGSSADMVASLSIAPVSVIDAGPSIPVIQRAPVPAGAAAPNPFISGLSRELPMLPEPQHEPPAPDSMEPTVKPTRLEVFMYSHGERAGPWTREEAPQAVQSTDPQPEFRGSTDIPYALIVFELEGPDAHIITEAVSADDTGQWRWQPHRAITPGQYALLVTVFDPSGQAALVAVRVSFEVIRAPAPRIPDTDVADTVPSQPAQPYTQPSPRREAAEPRYMIRARILSNQKLAQFSPGSEVYLEVMLQNLNWLGVDTVAPVHYAIINEQDEAVFQEAEQVALARSIQYVKRFTLKPLLPHGQYRIVISISQLNVTAVASDSFVVSGPAAVPVFAAATADLSSIMSGLLIVFSAAALIAYLEHHAIERMGRAIRQISEQDLYRAGYIS